MSEAGVKVEPSALSEKPVHGDDNDTVKFPPLPDPTEDDFDEDVFQEEREFYKKKFPDLNEVKKERLHCTACDRHLGCSARNESRMRSHPMLRTLMCHTCHSFYNSGEFDKGDDGSELYCRWCGQGGQVYCCSDCPVVFCAKCIKRNFGVEKIKEIENTDDWKCFKCSPKCLWDLRAVCWALLRFCDLRNKIAYTAEDPKLKEAYQKMCAIDETECCRQKNNKRKERDLKRKAENEFRKAVSIKNDNETKKVANSITKLPPTIQVKKFASINLDESPPKKKRPASPKVNKPPIHLKPVPYIPNKVNPIPLPLVHQQKKIRLPPMVPQVQHSPMRFSPMNSYSRARKPQPRMPMMIQPFNNLSNMLHNPVNDNINLSLESLTQGLDMAAIANIANSVNHNNQNDDVVCTPDFPLEPLCEVTEENNDDDVECITPAPAAGMKVPPLAPIARQPLQKDLSSENIIQMTEDDVTVNEATGGLKFRVDPQTLSSNKMYRLPDGRVFAIHANPNMPGGYSATIVALAENNTNKPISRGSTFAAKLNPVTSTPSPGRSKPTALNSSLASDKSIPKKGRPAKKKSQRNARSSPKRVYDLKTPVEWYRYNLIDAVDSLQYAMNRLDKLKKETTSTFLRSRTVDEMRNLHKTLDSLLKTSSTRFNEIRDNLNADLKRFVAQKSSSQDISDVDEDDDDVEILNDGPEEPIFIDENSLDSVNANETNGTNDVDLTGAGSSEHNESGEKTTDVTEDPLGSKNDNNISEDICDNNERHCVESGKTNILGQILCGENMSEVNGEIDYSRPEDESSKDKVVDSDSETKDNENDEETNKDGVDCDKSTKNKAEISNENNDTNDADDNTNDADDNTKDSENNISMEDNPGSATDNHDKNETDPQDKNVEEKEDKSQDTEMTDELIENLLKDDNVETSNCMDIPDDFQEP